MSGLNMSQVARELISRLEAHIVKHDFVLNRNARCFTRTVDGAKQIFEFLFYKDKEGNAILVEPIVRIKLLQIEDIYHQVCTKEKEFFEATTTLGNSLGKIMRYYDEGLEIDPSENYKYVVRNMDESLDTLVKAICVYFDEYVLRYFEENSSVRRADELLNASPTEISIHNWLYPVRASLSLIAAKLNGNPRFAELEGIYSSKLQEAVQPYKTDFESVKKKLN